MGRGVLYSKENTVSDSFSLPASGSFRTDIFFPFPFCVYIWFSICWDFEKIIIFSLKWVRNLSHHDFGDTLIIALLRLDRCTEGKALALHGNTIVLALIYVLFILYGFQRPTQDPYITKKQKDPGATRHIPFLTSYTPSWYPFLPLLKKLSFGLLFLIPLFDFVSEKWNWSIYISYYYPNICFQSIL